MSSAYRKSATLSALPPSASSAAQQPHRDSPTVAAALVSAAMPGSTAGLLRDSTAARAGNEDDVSPLERALAARKAAKEADKAAKAEAKAEAKKAKKASKTATGNGDDDDDAAAAASVASKSSSVAWLLR